MLDVFFEYALRLPGYCLIRPFTRKVKIDDLACFVLSVLFWVVVVMALIRWA